MASVKTGLLAAVWLAMAAAAAAGVDLSGEYWFGSLSADVSSHVPWGKRGNVAISGTIWVQEWDDPAGHHSFYSSFTTDVQADGSINVNLSSGAYNVAWNGEVMIHADTAPDASNRLGIDFLVRKASNITVNDLAGEYRFFGHWLGTDSRWDEVGWGNLIINSNNTLSYSFEFSEGSNESDSGTWDFDYVNGIGQLSGVTNPFYMGTGGILAVFRPTADVHPDLGYDLFIKKTSQTITRADMAGNYQVRFLETGPGGVPYTCGRGTCVMGADGSFTVDAYHSDGEHEQFATTYQAGPGNKFKVEGIEGIINLDKGLVLLPELDRPQSPSEDDWIGGIIAIRAANENPKYSLTATVTGGHGTVLPSSGSYYSGTVVNLTATAEAGYRVKAWQGTDQDHLTTAANTVTMDGDKTVTVEFEEITKDVLAIGSLTVKAGKTRASHSDSLVLKGGIGAEYLTFIADPVNDLNDITIGIFSEDGEQKSGLVNMNLDAAFVMVDAKRSKISYKAPAVTGQPVIVFAADLMKGTFSLTGKNLDLTGVQSPVRVELSIGDYIGGATVYDGEASGSGGELDVINGAKNIPVQFQQGYADTLGISKYAFVVGTKKPHTDKLAIQGVITLADTSVDMAEEDVTITWGNFSVVLAAEDLYRVGDKMVFKYIKPKGSASPVAGAIFDLGKCTFKISIAKADIGVQASPVDFSIQFGNFHETVSCD